MCGGNRKTTVERRPFAPSKPIPPSSLPSGHLPPLRPIGDIYDDDNQLGDVSDKNLSEGAQSDVETSTVRSQPRKPRNVVPVPPPSSEGVSEEPIFECLGPKPEEKKEKKETNTGKEVKRKTPAKKTSEESNECNWFSANYTGGARYGTMSGASHREYKTGEEISKMVTDGKEKDDKRLKKKIDEDPNFFSHNYTGGSRYGSVGGSSHREYMSLDEIKDIRDTINK